MVLFQLICFVFLVAVVMKSMLKSLGSVGKPMFAIPILKRAIFKLQEKPYQLTILHYLLCQACLMSNNLKPAISLLEQDIYVMGTDDVSIVCIILYVYFPILPSVQNNNYLGINIFLLSKISLDFCYDKHRSQKHN